MAKSGILIGYAETQETAPDVWKDVLIERRAIADVVRNSTGLKEGEKVNLDLTISNSLSIVADEYAHGHISAMRYVKWRGARWIVSSVVVEHPRLVLRLGGLYDGSKAGAITAPQVS